MHVIDQLRANYQTLLPPYFVAPLRCVGTLPSHLALCNRVLCRCVDEFNDSNHKSRPHRNQECHPYRVRTCPPLRETSKQGVFEKGPDEMECLVPFLQGSCCGSPPPRSSIPVYRERWDCSGRWPRMALPENPRRSTSPTALVSVRYHPPNKSRRVFMKVIIIFIQGMCTSNKGKKWRYGTHGDFGSGSPIPHEKSMPDFNREHAVVGGNREYTTGHARPTH